MADKPTREQLEQIIADREKVIRELRATADQFKAAFEATGDGLWDFEPETGALDLGAGWYTMLGFAPHELPATYETWVSLLHPDDLVRVQGEVETFLAGTERDFCSEFRLRTKQADWLWVHSRGRRFQDPDCGNFHLIGTHVDITERKRLETELLQTQLSFDHASLGIFWIADNGQVANVNEEACRSLGYTREELCRLSVPDFDPTFTPESFLEHRRNMSASRGGTIESLHRRKDGTTFPVEISISFHEYKGERFSVSFQTDISERKKAQEIIANREQRLESIFRASPAGIGMVVDRTLVEVNDHFCEMIGYPKEALLGQDAKMLYPTLEEYQRVGDEKYRQIKRDGTGTLETVMKRPDGTLIDVLMSSSPLDQTDYSQGVIFTTLDITAQKQAADEKKRIEAKYRQTQKVEAIGQLAGGVAHDLNNLLSPVLGFTEMLLDDTAVGDPRRESLEQVMKAGMGARDLVRQLLAFSRKQTLEYAPLDLNTVIAGFEKLLRRTLREDIVVKLVQSPDIPSVMADVGQIEQVIMNLAINAADAMPDGGCLTIETQLVDLDQDYVREHPGAVPGPHVMLVFSDTGHGMDAETSARIFEPFYSTKGQQGTGLGLSTVYGIVKQHNGNIWVYSEPSRGTTFKIYLPAAVPTEAPNRKPAARSEDLKGTETILLVEDNNQVRRVTQAILERMGYTVLAAAGGDEALKLLADHPNPPDLLFTDVVMPGMNGRELHVRMTAKMPHLKVLYMSGYSDNVIAHHGVVNEGVQFIQKPFTTEVLGLKLRDVLQA